MLDANQNGLPEITLLTGYLTQGGHYYQIIEWDGTQFQDMLTLPKDIQDQELFVEARGNLGYEDFDHDGMLEYVANIGVPVWETYQYGIPWRGEKQVYKWNGSRFAFQKQVFAPPQYRFQAVQDGDRAAREGDYPRALDFYQQAIFNDKLEWWSPERKENIKRVFFSAMGVVHEPTPIPGLTPDPQEYDHLAAYSRYRIALLHLTRGWTDEAQIVYDTLQRKYPDGTPGHIYAVLAETFWNEYARSKDLKQACGRVLEHAAQNQASVFDYLSGREYYGQQGINYRNEPEWICPYR